MAQLATSGHILSIQQGITPEKTHPKCHFVEIPLEASEKPRFLALLFSQHKKVSLNFFPLSNAKQSILATRSLFSSFISLFVTFFTFCHLIEKKLNRQNDKQLSIGFFMSQLFRCLSLPSRVTSKIGTLRHAREYILTAD